jgi:hypothetical protein
VKLYTSRRRRVYSGLARACRALDLAVVAAYGSPASTLDDTTDRNRRRYELNAAIVARPQRLLTLLSRAFGVPVRVPI